MPIIDLAKVQALRKLGFRKVWGFNAGLQDYADKPESFAHVTFEDYIFCEAFNKDGTRTINCPKFIIDQRAFNF